MCSEGRLSTGGLGGGPCGAGGSRRGRGGQWIQDRGQRQVLLSPAVPHPGHRALAVPEPLPGASGNRASPEAVWGDAAASAGVCEPRPRGHALSPLGREPCSSAHKGVSATSRSCPSPPRGLSPGIPALNFIKRVKTKDPARSRVTRSPGGEEGGGCGLQHPRQEWAAPRLAAL